MNKKTIAQHLYNDNVSQAIKYVQNISDEETLFVYTYNYNWDDGFEIPKAILTNKYCTLSVALLLFRAADGLTFLQDQSFADSLPEWKDFITMLYEQIINGKYVSGKASYDPELSKVQEYKLKKTLAPEEYIFITALDGEDYNIHI